MKRTARALMLVLALSVTGYAGDMGNGIAPQPMPQPQQAQATSGSTTSANDSISADGDMSVGLAATEAALGLLKALLTLI
jgi:hypothetical protein